MTNSNSSLSLSPLALRKGWQVVKFGDIAKNISKRVNPSETDLEVYVGLEHLDPQSLRITRRGVPSDIKGQKLRVRPGQIIFGKRRAYQKKLAVADFDGICSAHAMVLQAVPGKIIPELLPFFMQSDMFMDRAVAISEGSLSPTIKWKTLAIQEFPLPPIERQKEILEVLEKVEETQAKIDDSITTLEKFKYVYGYYRCKSVNDNKIPLRSIGELKNGVNKSKEAFGKGYPFVNLDDVFLSAFIKSSPNGLVKVSKKEIENYSLQKNDILFVRSSVKPSGVGLTSLIKNDLDRTVYAGFLIRLRLKKGFDSEYLNYSFHEPFFRHQLMAYVTVSANSNINQGGLEQLHVYYPNQNEINQTKAVYRGIYQALTVLRKKQRNVNQLTMKITNNLLGIKEVFNKF